MTGTWSRRDEGRRVGALLAFTCVALARGALADEHEYLTWEAPSGCPSEASVRAAVHRWLERPESAAALRTIHVVGKVSEAPRGWSLDLSFESSEGTGRQTLVAERCQTLADIVALDIALAADPTTMLQAMDRGNAPPRIELDRRTHAAFGARLSGGGVVGSLPGASPGVALAVLLTRLPFRAEVGVAYFPQREARYGIPGGIGANLDLIAATLRGCVVPALGVVELPICAGVEGGDVRAVGFGVEGPDTAHRLHATASLGPAVAVPLSSTLYAWAEVQAALALVRPGYGMRNLPELYRPGAISGRAFLGIEVRFP